MDNYDLRFQKHLSSIAKKMKEYLVPADHSKLCEVMIEETVAWYDDELKKDK